MNDAASPAVANRPGVSRKRQSKKYIVTPGTVEQISQGVGVTKKDIALVGKVLSELGYVRDKKSGALLPVKTRKR